MSHKSVLVGISGGIDSAAAVFLLREQGYEVEALYIDMLGCGVAREKVEQLAAQLNVKLHIAHCGEEFRRSVIDRVIMEHRNGHTPSPCTICNPELKFKTLEHMANSLSINHIATGHYINIEEHQGRYYIKKGHDEIKDQSYYLYSVAQTILRRTLTPLGRMLKTVVREYLAAKGFVELSSGGESQGVCFAKRGYGAFIAEYLAPQQGDILDEKGVKIGTHSGYPLYTIGQKRGFALSDTKRAGEVRAISATSNTITVGEPLMVGSIELGSSWYSPLTDSTEPTTIKIRGLGRNPSSMAKIRKLDSDSLEVTLSDETDKFWAPATGQPAVIYQGGLVVGGGVVRNYEKR